MSLKSHREGAEASGLLWSDRKMSDQLVSSGADLPLLGPMIPDGLERIFPHDGMREEADCG